jgi:endonuclease/exonuclease/phosphatase family metal-dependent hydrolase
MSRFASTTIAYFVLLGCGASADDPAGTAFDAAVATIDAPAIPDAAHPIETIDAQVVPTECETSVSVFAFNLLHDFPAHANIDVRSDMVASFINEVKPDFVSLQEVSEGPVLANRAELIAGATGYDWMWGPASGVDFVFTEGPGILSKRPIKSSEVFELPRPIIDNTIDRVLVKATVDNDCGEVSMFSTHIGEIDAVDPTFTSDLVLGAYQLIVSEGGTSANLFGATVNAPPDSPGMKMIRGEEPYEGVLGDMRDAWMVANPDDHGNTYHSSNPGTRLDYILFRDGELASTTPSECSRVLMEPNNNGVMASDHVGVLCTFQLVVTRSVD